MTSMDMPTFGPAAVLIFFRTLSILWLVPLFPSRSLSAGFKAGLSLLISLLLCGSTPTEPQIENNLLSAIVWEVFIGFCIGFGIRLLFAAVQAAGQILSLQSGLAFAQFMDPVSMTNISVIDQFKNLLALMLFFAMDCHHMLISGLASSLVAIPVGGSLRVRPELVTYLTTAAGRLFATGFKIAAPVIVTLLLVEITLAMLGRMVPQVNVFLEGAPAKILVAVIVLSLSLTFIMHTIGGVFMYMPSEISRILRAMV